MLCYTDAICWSIQSLHWFASPLITCTLSSRLNAEFSLSEAQSAVTTAAERRNKHFIWISATHAGINYYMKHLVILPNLDIVTKPSQRLANFGSGREIRELHGKFIFQYTKSQHPSLPHCKNWCFALKGVKHFCMCCRTKADLDHVWEMWR